MWRLSTSTTPAKPVVNVHVYTTIWVGQKIFHCPSCRVTLDRDLNGARNIYLRYFTLQNKRSGNSLMRIRDSQVEISTALGPTPSVVRKSHGCSAGHLCLQK